LLFNEQEGKEEFRCEIDEEYVMGQLDEATAHSAIGQRWGQQKKPGPAERRRRSSSMLLIFLTFWF
jgi:hypothetical protein